MASTDYAFSFLKQIGPSLWNVRSSFKMFKGLIDIGTHMSIVQLNNGKFLLIDTVDLTPPLKQELDHLTDNGRSIEAVIATHPFHTTYFQPFYAAYPQAKFYGTPRHLRVIPSIPWAGHLNCEVNRALWEPDVFMRIPAGSEFVAPLPEKSNHFSNVFVFHPLSRSLHNDDTVCFSDKPGFLMSLAGFKHGSMMFHPSLKGPGLYPTPEAPTDFQKWMLALLNDWDFDNLLSAHNGNKIGGAKAALYATLTSAEPLLQKLAKKASKGQSTPHVCGSTDDDAPHNEVACG